MSTAIKSGPEFLVNSTTAEDQSEPVIAALSDGRFVVAWTDWSPSAGDTPPPGEDMSVSAIRAQIFDAAGNKLDEEFVVNTTTNQGQNMPAITALTDGRFLITWADASHSGGDTSAAAVRAQVFNAGGVKVGAEFIVPAERFNSQVEPTVAGLAGGRFVAVWTDYSGTGDTNPPGIRARTFGADGSAGAEFQVNATTASYQIEPTIAVLSDGRFVVAWTDYSSGVGSSEVRARIFDADGEPLTEERVVNTTTSSGQFEPAITALANGGFVVAWTDTSMSVDGSAYGVLAQVFDADGEPVNGEFLVNETTSGRQQQPSLTALPEGRFVAVWADGSGTTATSTGIRAQVFESNGQKAGPELVVNTTDNLVQWKPTVTALTNGSFVVTWEDQSETGGDTDGSAIRAQIFSFGDQAPVITSNGGGDSAIVSMGENTNAVTTVTAAGDLSVAYLIVGGADESFFQIDDLTGQLSFAQAPDFETAADADHDNSYEVVVRAFDGTLYDDQAITVHVTDANETPAITSNGGGNGANILIAENKSAVTTVTAADPDNDALTYSIVGGADAGLFQIDEVTGALSFISAPDYESPDDIDENNSYVVQVRASDSSNLFDEQTITVNVADAAAPAKSGNEFLVNTTTESYQAEPAITGLASGRFVVVWRNGSSSPDDSDDAIRGQVFNADGSKAGGEFRVNATTSGGQFGPAITELADGRFVVTWASDVGDGSDTAILGQIFGADGTPLGSELVINATTENYQESPSVTALADGRFVAVWSDYSQTGGDTSEYAIRGRIFSADGTQSVAEFLVNTTAEDSQYEPAITALADGNFVVAWSDYSETGGDQSSGAVRAQVFHSDGAPLGSELLVNTTTYNFQNEPTITALADGRFVVAWSDYSHSEDDPSGYAVRARIFGPDGSEPSAEFLVNTATFSYQQRPQLTALADGRFVASWLDSSESGRGVRAQVFDADGIKSGDEFWVAAPAATVDDHAVATLADGRFVIAWSGYYETGGDTSSSAIRAQIFDPREGPVNLVGTPLDDDLVGTAFNDTITGLAGNDTLDGGGGYDTAVFLQGRNKYTIADVGDAIVVQGPDGTDILYNFEHLQFAEDAPAPFPPQAPDPAGHVTGLFDTAYYLSHNPDVAAAKVSAIDHYGIFGWHEGRNPNAFFDDIGYVAANGLAAGSVTPIDHYHQTGWLQGRDPGANFDTKLYLIHNPDVAAANTDPLEHYLQHGRAEGRAIYQAIGENLVNGFDAEWYLFHNPDVAAAGVGPLEHFNTCGWHEGRNPNALFDTAGYLAHYGDVAAAGVNPLEHYWQFGWKEGRDPSAGFDTAGYLAANPDVGVAGVNPLEHYLQFGIYEGRQIGNDGVWG